MSEEKREKGFAPEGSLTEFNWRAYLVLTVGGP